MEQVEEVLESKEGGVYRRHNSGKEQDNAQEIGFVASSESFHHRGASSSDLAAMIWNNASSVVDSTSVTSLSIRPFLITSIRLQL